MSPTSPAIDRALDASCPDTDQRGVARPFDGDFDSVAGCDAGAVEFQLITPTIPALSRGGLLLLAVLLAGAAVLRLTAGKIG